jgi:hypothetical protein
LTVFSSPYFDLAPRRSFCGAFLSHARPPLPAAPWSVEELDACFVVRDQKGCEMLTQDEARRIAAKIA